MKKLLLISAALLAAGCAAIRPAQMALPAGLEARTVAASIDGLGGGRSGSFTIARNEGSFTRSADRLALFDELAVFNWGGAGYTVRGADFAAPVSARCKLRQATATLGVVEFRPKKLAYECDFEGAAPFNTARLSLQESATAVGTLGRAERRGRITVGGTVLALRSVHDLVGSPLQLAFPIGYVVEQDGQPLAAVELNGTVPQLRLPTSAPAETRQAVLVAALALAVLWDPAAQ